MFSQRGTSRRRERTNETTRRSRSSTKRHDTPLISSPRPPRPPRSPPSQFPPVARYINNPGNSYEGLFIDITSTGFATSPFLASASIPSSFPTIGPQPHFSLPQVQSHRWGVVGDISGSEYADMVTDPSRPRLPIIDNVPPEFAALERDHLIYWLRHASSEVKHDLSEFRCFSQNIIAKALRHVRHEYEFFKLIDNEFSSSQLLQCIYYLSTKINEKDPKSSCGYEPATKEARDRNRRHGSRKHDPRLSPTPLNVSSVDLSDQEDSFEDDFQQRLNITAVPRAHDHHASRRRQRAEAPSATNQNRSEAASAAATAAIGRATDLHSHLAESEPAYLRQRLAEIETVLQNLASSRLELEELRRKAEARTCKICYAAEIDCIFVDCYHMATCLECAQGCDKCPVCRKEGVSVAKVYL